jgi:2-C-methyl-D-erythritol 4-phosphate cytidylyltransferase
MMQPADINILITTNDIDGLTAMLREWFGKFNRDIDPRIRLCAGGDSRAQSVRKALAEVSTDIEWVAVHDAARPLINGGLIERTLTAAVEHGAAVPALPVHLTIKQATAPLPARVTRTIPRDGLWAMQTPQIMRRADLIEAFDRCPLPLDQITDDVQLLELAGKEVWLVAGEESNIKITTQFDLRVAKMILRAAPHPDPSDKMDSTFFVAPPPLSPRPDSSKGSK